MARNVATSNWSSALLPHEVQPVETARPAGLQLGNSPATVAIAMRDEKEIISKVFMVSGRCEILLIGTGDCDSGERLAIGVTASGVLFWFQIAVWRRPVPY